MNTSDHWDLSHIRNIQALSWRRWRWSLPITLYSQIYIWECFSSIVSKLLDSCGIPRYLKFDNLLPRGHSVGSKRCQLLIWLEDHWQALSTSEISAKTSKTRRCRQSSDVVPRRGTRPLPSTSAQRWWKSPFGSKERLPLSKFSWISYPRRSTVSTRDTQKLFRKFRPRKVRAHRR